MKARALAAKIINDVMLSGQSLSRVIKTRSQALGDSSEQALLQELSYGVLRWWSLLEAVSLHLLKKPLKAKDSDIRNVILIGLYQLAYMRIPDHAVVSETVKACAQLKKPWAKQLVNAVLRGYLRRVGEINENLQGGDAVQYAHPEWMLDSLKSAWPDHWRQVVVANNARPPMVLRVNRRKTSRDQYLQYLKTQHIPAQALALSPDAVELQAPRPVHELPGFEDGLFSVQDEAAQLAAGLLQPQAQQVVLDVCAAPGGKTAHLLEIQPALRALVAMDIDPERLQRIKENLVRLGLQAELRVGDASQPGYLAQYGENNRLFDRILLDAPCSASGVIRRHPDIKWLRRPQDIAQLARVQQQILQATWPLLASGGMLLYATCSVLPQENGDQIEAFLAARSDAQHITIEAPWGHECEYGRQLLPGDMNTDGFYYACLKKR